MRESSLFCKNNNFRLSLRFSILCLKHLNNKLRPFFFFCKMTKFSQIKTFRFVFISTKDYTYRARDFEVFAYFLGSDIKCNYSYKCSYNVIKILYMKSFFFFYLFRWFKIYEIILVSFFAYFLYYNDTGKKKIV